MRFALVTDADGALDSPLRYEIPSAQGIIFRAEADER